MENAQRTASKPGAEDVYDLGITNIGVKVIPQNAK
jgi:hypothetical protein